MNKSYKIDLHTHSIYSRDGGITGEQYALLIEKEILDCIAITDHNETEFARTMANKFGTKIIVGEEITTSDGEIIGLFLKKTVPKNLSAIQTVKQIREQGGVVYIPHPFEILRHGIKEGTLEKIIEDVDIIEVFNARARWRGEAERALACAQKYKKAMASSSDSHCRMGMGSSCSIIEKLPNAKTLASLLTEGNLVKQYAPALSYLCPAINKIMHKFIKYVG